MSLKEKLGSLTQKLETEKVVKKQTEQDEQLKPVRANIKKLETSRKALDLIKNSLDFKELNRPDEHVGMIDYAEKTGKKLQVKSGEIDTLISENKEALETLGVKDRDQLSAHPEFAEEPEVIEYKKATEQDKGLKMSDAKLKERLTKLGIEFDSENFSYEAASKAVGEKLENINKELTQEKLKTPEGREDVVNNLAEEFEKNSGKMELQSVYSYDKKSDPGGINRDQPDYSYDFGTDRNSFRINFKDEKAKVTNWSSLKLIPDNFKDTEATYGEEIAREALEKAYQNKVHDNFVKWDERGDKAVSLKEQIKAVSPEERRAAQIKLNEFTEKQNEALRALRAKSEELKTKGIDFSSDYASGYGCTYEEFIDLTEKGTYKYVSESLNKNDFPPQYDFVKLLEAIDKRMEQVDKFIEVIRNIKDEKGIENLLENRNSDAYIGKIHKDKLNVNFREGVQFKLEGNNNQASRKLTEKCKTYSEAEKYLNEIIKLNSEGENKVSEAIMNTIKAQLKMRELEQNIKREMNQGQTDSQIYTLESKIFKIARDKEEAIKVMGSLKSLQFELPQDEELSLSGRTVTILSVEAERNDYLENYPRVKNNLAIKESELEKHKSAEPKIFGKERWQTKLNELKKEKDTIQAEVNKYANKNTSEIFERGHKSMDVDLYSDVGKIVNSQEAKGKASEIFSNLQAELTKVIDTTLPPKIMADYAEYKTLAEKIS